MAEKKGFLATLFGGNKCDCGISVEEESTGKKSKKKGSCCNMEIVEEPACSCNEETFEQSENGCICDESEKKDELASDSCCCDGNK